MAANVAGRCPRVGGLCWSGFGGAHVDPFAKVDSICSSCGHAGPGRPSWRRARETLPRNAPSTQQQMRLELLQQVARFDAKTLRSEGAMVTDESNGERFRFDLRTGAIHASAPDCASVVTGYTKCYFIDRAGHKYLELKRDKRTKLALRLIGSPHATHTQGVVDEGPNIGPVAWVMAESITSPLDAVVRIRRTEAVDGLLTYELSTKRFRGSHFQPALLRIESDRLRLSERGNKTVWERGPQRIRFPAMDRVVSRRSFSIAFNALAARGLSDHLLAGGLANCGPRFANPKNPVRTIRQAVFARTDSYGVRARNVPGGKMPLLVTAGWPADGQ